MRFFDLSGPRAAAFIALMVVAILLLGYVGWLLGSSGRGSRVGSLPTPTPVPQPIVELTACAQPTPPPVSAAAALYEADLIELGGDVVPTGLAHLPASRTLVFGQSSDQETGLGSVTLFGDASGSSLLPVDRADSLATTTDGDRTLIALDSHARVIHRMSRNATGVLESVDDSIDLRNVGLGEGTSMGVDRQEAALVLLDAEHERLVRMELDDLRSSSIRAGRPVSGCIAPVADIATSDALTVRPTDGHVFAATGDGPVLHELDRTGREVATFDLGGLVHETVRGMTFAPTADPDDAADALHLYVLAVGSSGARIHALSFTPVDAAPASVRQFTGTVIRQTSTSAFDPPSSDPGGITYDARRNRFIITDSDIDELPEFAGHVVFALDDAERWMGLGTPRDALEVTDVAVDPDTNRWFFSEDGQGLIILAEPGDDGLFGTRDDDSSEVSTTDFRNSDPEGIAFGQGSLFVTDGVGARVYRLAPGSDGAFSGVPPIGDDEVTSFDTAALGVTDPEGIAFDPERGTLWVLSRKAREPIIEVATDGTLLSAVTLERGALNSPGGITRAPAPDGSGRVDLFVADRGEDNANSAAPNDGHILQIQLTSTTGG